MVMRPDKRVLSVFVHNYVAVLPRPGVSDAERDKDHISDWGYVRATRCNSRFLIFKNLSHDLHAEIHIRRI